jgi:kinesin family protein 3/17
MEEKLIKGGEVIAKASKQEMQLKKAEKELRERMMQEAKLARELAEKEETNLQLEEHFSSLQEEVEVKTKKLKKLWSKYQGALKEAQDLQEEFQTERTDMLDTIRELTRNIKLKDTIIQNFIPEETAKSIEKRASWNNEEEAWMIPKIELSGNKIRTNRPISSNKLRRPETEYARHRKQYDGNSRYKYDNIIATELDMPERTTQEFEGPGMISRVDNILASGINDDADDTVTFSIVDTSPQNPYLQYTPDSSDSVVKIDDSKSTKTSRPKSGKKTSSSSNMSSRDKESTSSNNASNINSNTSSGSGSSSRPKSASRKR